MPPPNSDESFAANELRKRRETQVSPQEPRTCRRLDLGNWPDESPMELAELKKTGKFTIPNAIWLSWMELFKELGPQMIAEK
jgi:hypothetical protein